MVFVPGHLECGKMAVSLFSHVWLFITACKWSLGQDNIFTSVCQEFCSQGDAWSWLGCLVPGGHLVLDGCLVPGVPGPKRGCLVQGVPGLVGCLVRWGAWSWGCLVLGRCLVQGGAWSRGLVQGSLVRSPLRWLLLQAVCILLQCILLYGWFIKFRTMISLCSKLFS